MMWVRSALVVVMIASVGCGQPGGGAGTKRGRAESRQLFATSVTGFERTIRSSEGLPTVVNVWATWCIPCRAEMPRLVAASERYAGRVRFLGLNTQDDPPTALRFIEEFAIPFPSAQDPRGTIAKSLKVLGLPATLFYSEEGDLAFVHNGEIKTDDLRTKIDELLN